MTSKLNINWLNKCRCGNRMHTVETVRGSHVRLFEDDAVKCNACGREGVIQTCDAIATVLWETDEERAESVTMTKSTITRERLAKIKSWRETYGAGSNVMLPAEEAEELACLALAAMDSEPVGYFGRFDPDDEDLIDQCSKNVKGAFPLYRHAQQPVVPDRSIFEKWWESQNGAPLDGWDSLRTTDGYCDGGIDGQFEAWNAAMLQELKKSAGVSNNCRSNENLQDQHVESLTTIKATPDLDSLPKNAESRSGNSPVIQEGYVMVPMRLTAENGAKGVLSGEFSETQFVNCPECFGDDECETCDGSGRIEIKVPVSWTTIKEIWIKGVEYFAAAPQENN